MPSPKDTIGDPISEPHRHDVLSGRGNYVNNHPGNEHFRSLVRMHKVAYVATPKSQKPKFSRLIYDAIKNLDPPGRFLKQGEDGSDKMWYEITEKKALDKTRQALREGAPEIRNILEDGTEAPVSAHPGQLMPPQNQRQQEADEMAAQMEQQIQAQLLQLQQIQQTQQQLQQLQQQVADVSHHRQLPCALGGLSRQTPGVLNIHQRSTSGSSTFPNPCLSNALQGFGGPGGNIDGWSPNHFEQGNFLDSDRMQMPPPSTYSRHSSQQTYGGLDYPDSTLPLSGGGHAATEKLYSGGNNGSYLAPKGRPGMKREDSVQLGDVLKEEVTHSAPEGKRRNSAVQMSMGMSFSLGDIDSGLSKMMEDSLDLDGHGGTGGFFTQHSMRGRDITAVGGGSAASSNFSALHVGSASASGHFSLGSTALSGTLLSPAALMESAGTRDALKRREDKNGNMMSFSQLIDFNDSYQTSFKSDK